MRVAPGVATLILLAGAHDQLAGQSTDSAQARRNAARAQARFETIRRANLPVYPSGSGGVCDARVGRFCHWNGGDTLAPRDNRTIRRARERLLATLDSLARRAPTDTWITAQRVRYLVEAGQDSAALRAANTCAGERWWCSALQGLALHQVGSYSASETAFAGALAAMPDAERCKWTDMSILLSPAQRKRFGKVGCGSNEQVARHIWWLADPLWSLPGNDRLTEHYARHTMARILDGTRAGYDVSWGNDIRELLLRYGWVRFWTRSPPHGLDPNARTITGHDPVPNFHFIPVVPHVDSVVRLDDSWWKYEFQQSQERYAPAFAKKVSLLRPQIARFRRGDSMRVVVAYDFPREQRQTDTTLAAALAISSHPDTQVIVQSQGKAHWLGAILPQRPTLLSVEVLSARTKQIARSRRALLPLVQHGRVAISDLLLFSPDSTNATTLDSLLPRALHSPATQHGTVGVYWEVYGLSRTDTALPVTVTLTRTRDGQIRRMAEAIGLAKRMRPLSIAWSEPSQGASISERAIALDLTRVPRGRYVLRVTVAAPGQPAPVATREIELR